MLHLFKVLFFSGLIRPIRDKKSGLLEGMYGSKEGVKKILWWNECVRILNMTKPLLVLAKQTAPRRRELLALGGWMFHTRPADVDESQRPGEAPGEYVLRLAESKARTCAETAHADLTIVAGRYDGS